jgi:hypothetical protein
MEDSTPTNNYDDIIELTEKQKIIIKISNKLRTEISSKKYSDIEICQLCGPFMYEEKDETKAPIPTTATTKLINY